MQHVQFIVVLALSSFPTARERKASFTLFLGQALLASSMISTNHQKPLSDVRTRLLLGVGATVTTLGALWLWAALSALHERMNATEDRTAKLVHRLAALEAAVLSGKSRDSSRLSASNAEQIGALAERLETQTDRLNDRLDSVEAAMATINGEVHIAEGEYSPQAPPTPSSLAHRLHSAQMSPREEPLADTHSREGGMSEWGTAAADQIAGAFGSGSYFQQYGGQLDTDCRQTQCILEWTIPGMQDFSEHERRGVIGQAHLELMALAAQNAEDVGRVQPIPPRNGDSNTLAIYFQKRDQGTIR